MIYQLLTRHSHHNQLLGKSLGVGDIVDVEAPQAAAELLAMRGGHSYGQAGFGGVSGQGYSYFSPVNFTLAELKSALEAPKGPSPEELKAQAEAEAKAKADAEAQAKAQADAEAKAKAEAEAAAKAAEAEAAKAAKSSKKAEEKPAE